MKSALLDRRQVEHLAKLAALSLSDTEAENLAKDLAAILAYVDELSRVDTSSVATGPFEGSPRAWREDRVRAGLSHEDALAAAPRRTDDGFAVPAFVNATGTAGGQ